MWKPLVAVFIVALVATTAVTNLDYFFPTESPSEPTCALSGNSASPSCCDTASLVPSCCSVEPSCCEAAIVNTCPSEANVASTGIVGGGMTVLPTTASK